MDIVAFSSCLYCRHDACFCIKHVFLAACDTFPLHLQTYQLLQLHTKQGMLSTPSRARFLRRLMAADCALLSFKMSCKMRSDSLTKAAQKMISSRNNYKRFSGNSLMILPFPYAIPASSTATNASMSSSCVTFSIATKVPAGFCVAQVWHRLCEMPTRP